MTDAGDPESSYGQILKSSAWIGGSSVIVIGLGVIRTKALAVMLGPSGFGLMGLYGSIVDLALAIASMGIGNAGVRQIAESVTTGDETCVARTIAVLRRVCMILGLLGAALLFAFASPISSLTFGHDAHGAAVAVLGLAVLFRLIISGQGALLQGLRRIHDLAVMNVMGAFLGGAITILLVYMYREQGIAPSLAAGAATGLLISWWYTLRVKVPRPTMTRADAIGETASLLKLGLAFMLSGLLMTLSAYAVRAMVLRIEGLDAAGYYSAAWTLGGLYVGIILQAMGADFYPRLVGVASDDNECNRLVNEQTLVSLLLAGPGIVATIVLAPSIITLFYTPSFINAVEALQWICLGVAMRVVTWPMGFILVAKNRQLMFVTVDAAWTLANLSLTWICVHFFGVAGAGIAFFGSYLFHLLLIYPLSHRLTGFSLSVPNRKIAFKLLGVLALVFTSTRLLPQAATILVGLSLVAATAWYSMRALIDLVPLPHIPDRALLLFQWLRMTPRISTKTD